MYKVTINSNTYDIKSTDKGLEVNGQEESWDLQHLTGNRYHAIKGHHSYLIEVLTTRPAEKLLILKINGRPLQLKIHDKYDLLLDQLGMKESGTTNAHEIQAPMPGLILEVMVSEGQQVMPGDKLLILEAMKMENVIKASGEGVVRTIYVKRGDNVEKSQVLIRF